MQNLFCWKNVSSSTKATHIFSANIRKLCIESAKTVNEMTLNELVKLTTLWTTGPRPLYNLYCVYVCKKCNRALSLPSKLELNWIEPSKAALKNAVGGYKKIDL